MSICISAVFAKWRETGRVAFRFRYFFSLFRESAAEIPELCLSDLCYRWCDYNMTKRPNETDGSRWPAAGFSADVSFFGGLLLCLSLPF